MAIDLVCKIDGKVVAYGTARLVEEFIFIEIPFMNPTIVDSFTELKLWLDNSVGWEVA